MRAIESERGGYLTVDDLMGERDGPFVGWEEIKRTGTPYMNLRPLGYENRAALFKPGQLLRT